MLVVLRIQPFGGVGIPASPLFSLIDLAAQVRCRAHCRGQSGARVEWRERWGADTGSGCSSWNGSSIPSISSIRICHCSRSLPTFVRSSGATSPIRNMTRALQRSWPGLPPRSQPQCRTRVSVMPCLAESDDPSKQWPWEAGISTNRQLDSPFSGAAIVRHEGRIHATWWPGI